MAHVVLKKSPGWKSKLKYSQENVGAKAEPPTRQTSVVFPTRVWEFLHFFFPVIVVFVIYHAQLLIKLWKGNRSESLFPYLLFCI